MIDKRKLSIHGTLRLLVDGIIDTDQAINELMQPQVDLLESLQEFVDYFKEWEYVLNDELRTKLHKAEAAINKATL